MGLTGEAPVAYRRSQRDRNAVESELPFSRTKRRDDFFSATATAEVNYGREGNGNVDDAPFEILRDGVDEEVSQGDWVPKVGHR
jgi:hypothetical protein